MSAATRERVRSFALAFDFVILITGAVLLLPSAGSAAVAAGYAIAVALATWKGGWRGGATAMILSVIAVVVAFRTIGAPHAAAFVATSLVVCGAARLRELPREEEVDAVDIPIALAPVVKIAVKKPRRPRILLLEKRRGTADTIVHSVRQEGVEIEVVERWIDAVDELFRFNPDAFFLDCDVAEFDKIYRLLVEHAPKLPIFLTAKQNAVIPDVPHAGIASRPYDAATLLRIARDASRGQ
jgi:CheY-like chemotaxis protein